MGEAMSSEQLQSLAVLALGVCRTLRCYQEAVTELL